MKPMVAFEKRRKAADLLLKFYKGEITNDQMVNTWPSDKRDRGLAAVYWGVWGLYSDVREHFADPRLRHQYLISKHVHRCLTFLNSQCEYGWKSLMPVPPGMDGMGTMQRISTGIVRKLRGEHLVPTPEEQVWPFSSRQDYYDAWRALRTM